jgi:hypothetical protein
MMMDSDDIRWLDAAAKREGITLPPETPLVMPEPTGWYCSFSMCHVEGRFCPICGRQRLDPPKAMET